MAAGCAIVATRVGGVPDAVVPGETGLLVEPGDPKALAAALATLLGDPERRLALGRAARVRAEARFSVERMVERYLVLYGLTDGRCPRSRAPR
jgi:glycosyltransferase involved in cell wall biosynthesis